MTFVRRPIEELWNYIVKAGRDECWLWQGTTAEGYGRFRRKGAHRVAWELTNGPIPSGLSVLHKCDVRRCCNPRHLFVGTQADNIADMVAKNRHYHGPSHYAKTRPERLARGDRHGSRLYPEKRARGDDHHTRRRPETVARGERNGLAKLTWEKVDEIRKLHRSGELISPVALANRFGVSKRAIQFVLKGRTWREEWRTT